MEYIIVSDTSVVAVNRGTKDNESSGIVYARECRVGRHRPL